MASTISLHGGAREVIEIPGHGTLIAQGTTVPADGEDGFATGCFFIHTDATTAATSVYVNTSSTKDSATFRPLTPAAQGASLTVAKPTFTIADAEGTPDNAIAAVINSSAWGLSTAAELITLLYKIQNIHTRLGELESRFQAIGTIA